MLKELIPFLIIGIVISTDSTSLAVAPVSNTLEKPLTTSDFFSIKITPNADPVTLAGTDINSKLKLGTAVLANCEADGTNWKCKPSEALEADSHVLALATDGAQIKSLTTAVTEDTKTVIIPKITARPKTATVKGEIAADTDIEITLTTNIANPTAVAGSDLSNYFKLGSVLLGTCSETGLAADATKSTSATIKCKTKDKLAVSSTPYTFAVQDSATQNVVKTQSFAVFGDVTVSAADAGGNGNNGSKFLNLSLIFFIFTFLF